MTYNIVVGSFKAKIPIIRLICVPYSTPEEERETGEETSISLNKTS